MYRSILVPLDGSTFAEHALPIACALAQRADAMLRLVHVHTLSSSLRYSGDEPVVEENLVAQSRKQARLYLAQVRERLAAFAGPELKITIENLEFAITQTVNEPLGGFLAAYAATTDADLIIMTTHGRSGLVRFWLGSVADTLVRLSHLPILLLQPTAAEPDFSQPPQFKNMLIPLDGSALAEQILEPALALGELLGTDYTLLRAVEPLFPVYNLLLKTQELDESGLQEAWGYLHQVGQQLAVAERRLHTRVFLATQPADAILQSTQRHANDLIALATHGKSGLTRLMVGSVADKLLRGATIPMLVYRPQQG